MLKRFTTALISIAIVLCAIPFSAVAAELTDSQDVNDFEITAEELEGTISSELL